MSEPKWDKWAIVKCPGCGAAVLDNRSDNVVKFVCGAEVWEGPTRYKPSLACLERRLDQQQVEIDELKGRVAALDLPGSTECGAGGIAVSDVQGRLRRLEARSRDDAEAIENQGRLNAEILDRLAALERDAVLATGEAWVELGQRVAALELDVVGEPKAFASIGPTPPPSWVADYRPDPPPMDLTRQGKVEQVIITLPAEDPEVLDPCPQCTGTGKVGGDVCPMCRGMKTRTLDVQPKPPPLPQRRRNMAETCPKCGAALKSHLPDDHWVWECGTGFYLPSRTLVESEACLRRQLAAEKAAREKAEADNAALMLLLREVHNEPVCCGNRPGQVILDELAYLREHHDECHQPAANYELLLCKLRGEPTNHGDEPVARRLDELQQSADVLAAIDRLRAGEGTQITISCLYPGTRGDLPHQWVELYWPLRDGKRDVSRKFTGPTLADCLRAALEAVEKETVDG